MGKREEKETEAIASVLFILSSSRAHFSAAACLPCQRWGRCHRASPSAATASLSLSSSPSPSSLSAVPDASAQQHSRIQRRRRKVRRRNISSPFLLQRRPLLLLLLRPLLHRARTTRTPRPTRQPATGPREGPAGSATLTPSSPGAPRTRSRGSCGTLRRRKSPLRRRRARDSTRVIRSHSLPSAASTSRPRVLPPRATPRRSLRRG